MEKKNRNAGRSPPVRLANVTVEPSVRLSSKSGARSPTLLPIFTVTTGAAVAVGSGVEVGGTGVAVGGIGVNVGGTAVTVGGTGIGVGGTVVTVGAGAGISVGTAVGAGSAVAVGAIVGVEGAPVYTPDGVGGG